MNNLAVEVEKKWKDHKALFEERLDDWLRRLEHAGDLIRRERKSFHQWNPLRVYVSVANVRSSSRVVFSLRFFGQEVAELFVEDNQSVLRLKGHSKKNAKYFGCELSDGDYAWKGREARQFRSRFKQKALSSKGKPGGRSHEHQVESKFIEEMLKGSGKFGMTGLQIQPVTIEGCPLQFPVPISASSGRAKKGNGHIDILARHRGAKGKTRLSVWELKKPHTYGRPAHQACIYALTLLRILRHTKSVAEWYRLFGYKSPIPRRLEIEAVVAVTGDQKSRFEREAAELKRSTPFEIDGDSIRLYGAFYSEGERSIRFQEDPFRGWQ